jgi:hypothetical protein
MCRITSHGRTRFIEYLGALEKVVADAAAAAESGAADPSSRHLLKGLSPA